MDSLNAWLTKKKSERDSLARRYLCVAPSRHQVAQLRGASCSLRRRFPIFIFLPCVRAVVMLKLFLADPG